MWCFPILLFKGPLGGGKAKGGGKGGEEEKKWGSIDVGAI